MLRNDDEDELAQILNSTISNNKYMDEQIGQLFLPNEPTFKLVPSQDILNNSSDHSENIEYRNRSSDQFNRSINSQDSDLLIKEQEQHQELDACQHPAIGNQEVNVYADIYREVNSIRKPFDIDVIRENFPLFLLSKPAYHLNNNIKENNVAFSGGLLRKNLLVMDVGYCQQEKVFKVAIGNDQGQVVIFEPGSSKPQLIIECFTRQCQITALKWSKNLQFMCIANDLQEIRVYMMKQSIQIETQISYKILKNPVEYCIINEKHLSHIIVDLHILQEFPIFKMVIVDEASEIFQVEVRKNVFNMRPYLTKLPVKFNEFSDLQFLHVTDKEGNDGWLMAVAGLNYITICLIQPSFEVAMVYDKEKHGGNIKKNGYPSISFRQKPNSLLVIWDKFLEVLNIQVESVSPLKQRINICAKHVFSDSTIFGAFISNTLFYQLSRISLKIFSLEAISKDENLIVQEKEIFQKKINFANMTFGDHIEEALSNHIIEKHDLRFLKGFFAVSHRTLFYCDQRGLHSIEVESISDYVNKLIENSNNWKVGLQVLADAYEGLVFELDLATKDIISSKIRQYSLRYINFLESIIKIQENQQLWNQEILFVFRILIQSQQIDFLLQYTLQKINKISLKLVNNLTPFILTNRVKKVTSDSLEILFEVLDKKVIKKMLYMINKQENQPDLPHQINNLLMKKQMYLQLIEINQKFNDFYTPFVLLVSSYCNYESKRSESNPEISLKKKEINHLLSYCTFDTLNYINTHRGEENQSKHILETVLPLLRQKIISILMKEEPIGLFNQIIFELFSGKCLELLNEMDNKVVGGDLMNKIISEISYFNVVEWKCQKPYWEAIFQLYERRIIKIEVLRGLRYMTLQEQSPQEYIEWFVQGCFYDVNKQLFVLPRDQLQDFFMKLLQTKQYI